MTPPILAATTGRRPILLVVDDQPVNIQALYQAFAADHQVLMATGGEQALALCASQQPDLVLLDVVMPGIDGHEVCRRLKADATTCDTPVIFVTAHNDEAAETLGLALGAVDFISKPVNPAIVRARVRGATLDQLVQTTGAMPVARVATTLEQVHSAIEWARNNGIVHRYVEADAIVFQQGSGRVLIELDPAPLGAGALPDACADARSIGRLGR